MLLLLLSACFVGGGDRSWSLDPNVRGVDLRLSNGSVTVLPGSEEELFIEWSGGGLGNRKIRPEPTLVGDVVLMDARCGGLCGGDITVLLPPGLEVAGTVERGDLRVELDQRSSVDACVAAGSLELWVPAGAWDLDLKVGAGSLAVLEVVHDPQSAEWISACVAAGDLTVLGL